MRHAITLVCAGLLTACSPSPAEPPPSSPAPTASTPDSKLAITDGRLSAVCLGARVDLGVSTSRRRFWDAPLYLEEQVFGLVGVSGAHVLDTVRAKAHSCKTYVGEINKPLREVEPDVELPGLQGADDSYAFCHSLADVGEGQWDCEAFLLRGDLIVKVTVGTDSEELVRSFLPTMVMQADQTLMKVG